MSHSLQARSAIVFACLVCTNVFDLRTAHAACEVAPAGAAAPAAADPRVTLLTKEARHARTWRVAWTSINAGLTLLPLGGLVVLPRKDRGDLIISASASAVSTLFTWFWPLDVEDDGDYAARLRPGAPHDCDATLERLIAHSADDEASRVTWPWHVGNFVSALIPAAIILFALHDRFGAAAAVVGGTVLGEVELLTQPTGLVDLPRSQLALLPLPDERGRGLGLSYRLSF